MAFPISPKETGQGVDDVYIYHAGKPACQQKQEGVLALDAQKVQIAQADKPALKEPKQKKQYHASQIKMPLFWVFQLIHSGLGNGCLQHGCHNDAAYPDGQCGVKGSHCRAVVFDSVKLDFLQLYRRSQKGTDGFRAFGQNGF